MKYNKLVNHSILIYIEFCNFFCNEKTDKLKTKNNTDDKIALPTVSGELVPLNSAAKKEKYVKLHKTVVREYVICADRFGGYYTYPVADALTKKGGFEKNSRL